MGDVGKAIDDRTVAIGIEPHSTDYFFRGWWRLDDGDPKSALADLSRAISMEKNSDVRPSTESALFFRALTLLRLRRFDDALADCTEVKDGFVIYVRGLGHLSKEKLVAWATERNSDAAQNAPSDL